MSESARLPVERRILTAEAVAFLDDLENEFGWRRGRILSCRQDRQIEIDHGALPDFLEGTSHIRESDWAIGPVPEDLRDRRVEITGPVDARMMINALNSGASVFMADFEDATTPTWENLLHGQANVVDAYRRELTVDRDQRTYRLHPETATLVVRPRGWHLEEKHFEVQGRPMSASLFDFGLYMFHGGRAALAAGSGPYLYLPKLESHLEARLWNDVFVWAEERLGLSPGTIKATVLIENVLAAFEMDEILYELKDHAVGLNAGRWDYIFSIIRKFRDDPRFLLPDRARVTMEVPFMMAYTDLMIETCHRRRAHAIGGMAAFIPNRKDPAATEAAIDAVRADKAREAAAGCDGTWVAHPDLVAVAAEEFTRVLGGASDQIHRRLPDLEVRSDDLLDVDLVGGVTNAGVRANITAGIAYLASWLGGTGAVAIDNLMEDAATVEISRSQIWQWVRHGVTTEEGNRVTETMIRDIAGEVTAELESRGGDIENTGAARKVFEQVALDQPFTEFTTTSAYSLID